ncbi:unnamed protein product [Paramecium sonneborni]|uniref:CHHC U11-48K-type domain-containing protein n=1 Tax=Paramecium sonneborni TaxID=65129 RepID=A0A8S1LLD0_9CILI|nr:unnamed protein product [Paramecium sonneborni]
MQQNSQVSCPYNSQHIMPSDRLIFHLSNECKDSNMYRNAQNNTQQNFLKIFRGQLSVSSNNDLSQSNNLIKTDMSTQKADFLQEKSISKIYQDNQSQIQKQMDNQFIDQFKNLNLCYQDQQFQNQELKFDQKDVDMI